jgi:hypothetical protein
VVRPAANYDLSAGSGVGGCTTPQSRLWGYLSSGSRTTGISKMKVLYRRPDRCRAWQRVAHLVGLERFVDGLIESRSDRRRRTGLQLRPFQSSAGQLGIAGLHDGRGVLERRDALMAHHRQRDDTQLSHRSRRVRVPPARKASNHDELRAASEGMPAQGSSISRCSLERAGPHAFRFCSQWSRASALCKQVKVTARLRSLSAFR